MPLRELIDPECGGANPLMRLGNHMINDAAHKDDGISGRVHDVQFGGPSTSRQQGFNDFSETQLVNEFLGQMSAPPPQTFRMDALLQEMREIDAQHHAMGVVQAPTVSVEVNNGLSWANEFDAKPSDVDEAVGQLKNGDELVKTNLTLTLIARIRIIFKLVLVFYRPVIIHHSSLTSLYHTNHTIQTQWLLRQQNFSIRILVFMKMFVSFELFLD